MTTLSCGIVGLPNVGKSTLYNTLTGGTVPAENYPFCTIDPHVGCVPRPDPRLDTLQRLIQPARCVPNTLTCVDIAGLVQGASQGEGLGNQFLSHVRQTHALLHVVRAYDNPDVIHVHHTVDPVRDAELVHLELILADMQTVSHMLDKTSKKAKSGDTTFKQTALWLTSLLEHLEHNAPARTWTGADAPTAWLRTLPLLTSKPMVYVSNVSDYDTLDHNPHHQAMQRYATQQHATLLPLAVTLEAEMMTLSPPDRLEFLASMGLQEPALNRLIRVAYDTLGLQTFFTAGPQEVRAWTLKRGSSAVEAAGVIHSDFEKGFIRADVISFDDFVACGSEQAAKQQGKWRLEGRDYQPQDGDIMHFRFNV